MPPVATSHRKQPCNGCRSRKKKCDIARPVCSNCRKWGISCDYTNRTYAAERTFGLGSIDGYADQDIISRSSTWTVEQSVNTLFAGGFPFQSPLPTASFPWQAEKGPPQNALTVPDIISGLDTDVHPDAASQVHQLVTPESTGEIPDPTGHDFAALLDCSIDTPGLNVDQASIPQSSGTDSPKEPGDASLWLKNDFLSESLLLELVDIYFGQHHIFLPFLHQRRYLEKIEHFQQKSLDRQETALLYAVIAIAAVSHPDPMVRGRRLEWFAKAKQLCENTEKRYPSLQGIQASVCICILAWTTGDYPLCWLSIGTAWRQAVTLGMNRIDSEQSRIVQETSLPTCALEKEEQRRTIWTLFLMDRAMAFPCGWPHAIDDRQFKVNLPVDEDVFQNANGRTPELNSTMPFSRTLRKMIMSTPTEGNSTTYQAILKAYILLGRATEHVHSLDASSDPEEHFREFQQLDTELSRFKLSLPRAMTMMRTSSVKDAIHIFWLNAILGVLVILLHHRPEAAAYNPLQMASPTGSLDPETSRVGDFEYCIAAGTNLSRMVQEATKISIDALINPHLGSSLYGCGRTLALHYSETKNEEIKSDIDMYLLLFDRIADLYPVLGTKFRNGMTFTLAQTPEAIRKMKSDGARGMLTKCGDWAGANPQATLQNLMEAFP